MDSFSTVMSDDDFGFWPAEVSAVPVEEIFSDVTAPLAAGRSIPVWPGGRQTGDLPLPALTASMRVETPGGRKRVDELTPGELVLTRDRGYQHLCWRAQIAPQQVHPILRSPITMVRIAAGTLGKTLPAEDVIVSASQRIMLADPRAEALFGAEEVLVAAGDLLHLDGVEPALGDVQEHIALLFDAHEVILVEGLWTESLLPEHSILDALPGDQRVALRSVQPRLFHATGRAAYMPARMVLNAREARLLGAL